MTTMLLKEINKWINNLTFSGKLENQSESEYSKPIDFYLDYISEPLDALSLPFEQIIFEINFLGRKNKRAGEVQERFESAVRIIVLNVLHMNELIGNNLFLAIPLNNNEYGLSKRYRPKHITAKQFKQAYEGLKAQGYITVHRAGYYDVTGDNNTYRTRIAATSKLKEIYSNITDKHSIRFISMGADETILLRNSKKELSDYQDNDFTLLARANLDKINAVLTNSHIQVELDEGQEQDLRKKIIRRYDNDNGEETQAFINLTATRLYRIFSNDSFSQGGRFYRVWWHNIPKEYRRHITINGKKTVEIDYASLHPNMIYALEGVTISSDPYDVHPNVNRNITKAAFNALLNANKFVKEFSDYNSDGNAPSWLDFLGQIKSKHPLLLKGGYFNSGYGLKLQYQDAQLAESILLHFADKGIPCLPVHDSFIIQDEFADELEAVMLRVYRQVFNQGINLKRAS